MTHTRPQPPRRPFLKRWDTWCILCVIVASSVMGGFSVGQYIAHDNAFREISGIRDAYKETLDSRNATLELCLRTTATAANSAAQSSEAAAQAIDRAAPPIPLLPPPPLMEPRK